MNEINLEESRICTVKSANILSCFKNQVESLINSFVVSIARSLIQFTFKPFIMRIWADSNAQVVESIFTSPSNTGVDFPLG